MCGWLGGNCGQVARADTNEWHLGVGWGLWFRGLLVWLRGGCWWINGTSSHKVSASLFVTYFNVSHTSWNVPPHFHGLPSDNAY
jgi:hypothetical protein